MGQPEGHADPIVLVLLRQRRRPDLRRLLDRDRRAVVRLEVLLPEPHGLRVEAVPLAPLPVDRVHAVEGPPVPLDLVVDLVVHLLDSSRSSPPSRPGGCRGSRGRVTPDLTRTRPRPGSEGWPILFSCGPWVTPRLIRPPGRRGCRGSGPSRNASSWTSLGHLRMSMMRPLTSIIQIIGLSSMRLGSVQSVVERGGSSASCGSPSTCPGRCSRRPRTPCRWPSASGAAGGCCRRGS